MATTYFKYLVLLFCYDAKIMNRIVVRRTKKAPTLRLTSWKAKYRSFECIMYRVKQPI
nr:MAG TPA: hypothetical protein [Caudoviricetes sp.]